MLNPGQVAPDFSLPNQHNQTVSLCDYKNKKNVILYFYPKDDTPGCTIEANEFTALANDFAGIDTVIIGVSKDDSPSHSDFIDKYNLKLELLADTNGQLCNTYEVWQEKEKNGVTKMGIVRSTFLINKLGALVETLYAVSPQGHAQFMLDKAKQL